MKKSGTILILLFGFIAGFASEFKPLSPFSKIDILGRVEVRLVKSDTNKITIKPGKFDVSKVSYSIEDDELKIKLLKGLPDAIKVNIEVFYNEVSQITLGGGAKLYNRGTLEANKLEIFSKSGSNVDLLIYADSVNVKLKRGAFVRLSGESNYVYVKTASGADYRATELENKTTEAVLNGGSAEVNTKGFIDATVRFGATLKYTQQPEKIKKKEQLGGEISILEPF